MTQLAAVDFEVISDERVGEGGFLTIRRVRMRNKRADGTFSKAYVCDFVVRPIGDDAVVVVLYRERQGVKEVLIRDELRPALRLGREGREPLYIPAIVAGIIEAGDVGELGIVGRALLEIHEESGYLVSEDQLERLGPAMFPSPGAMVEKQHFFAARIDEAATAEPALGDGSPMEEGAVVRWIPLREALDRCERGEISDMKTELALRRLAVT